MIETSLEGALVLEPRVFGDERGFFMESYNETTMEEIGIHEHFVQDNHSYSARNVVRGLHYQIQRAQGKLVRVVVGEPHETVRPRVRERPKQDRVDHGEHRGRRADAECERGQRNDGERG